ncbi:MAG: RICIN domain-containing protein [Fibrobacterales bacterium]
MKQLLIPAFALLTLAIAPANAAYQGYFQISKATNDTKCIDVTGASSQDGANVQQYDCNNTPAQQWEFNEIETDVYTIRNTGSGKLLDVEGWGQGENVQQWGTEVNSQGKKWKVVPITDGVVTIRPMSSLYKCLSIVDGSDNNGTNVISHKCMNSEHGKAFWIEHSKNTEIIDGPFKMKNLLSKKCADLFEDQQHDGADVIQDDCANTPAQVWNFTHMGNSVYTIRNSSTGRFLDKDLNSYNIQQWGTWDPQANQQWKIVRNYNGTYSMSPANAESDCMEAPITIPEGNTSLESAACISQINNYSDELKAQQWMLYRN